MLTKLTLKLIYTSTIKFLHILIPMKRYLKIIFIILDIIFVKVCQKNVTTITYSREIGSLHTCMSKDRKRILLHQTKNCNKIILSRSITLITKPCNNKQITTRTIMRMVDAAAKQSAARTVSLYSMQQRSYVSAHAGRISLKKAKDSFCPIIPQQILASDDEVTTIQSDVKGGHTVAVLAVCSKTECKNTNCAEETTETNPCGASAEFHQGPISEAKNPDQFGIVFELNGALTHTIPPMLNGAYLASVDVSGKESVQYVVKETGVIPVEPTTFKESVEKTAYVQTKPITARLIQNTPSNSVLNINNKEPSILLPKVNTPLDDKF